MNTLPRSRPPLAFVSYDPTEVELRDELLGLANRLRHDGVEARIDLYEPSPAEGWELWRERQLLAADFVIVVCTPSYRQCFEAHDPGTGGLQVRWEAGFVRRRLHDDPSFGARVLPVLLHDTPADAVPEVLQGCTPYALPSGYDELYRQITGQPAIVGPPLGRLRYGIDNLGPRSLVFEGREDQLAETRDALRRSSKLMNSTVLAGMGGVGKTRLALEHAYCGEADYDVRWWVRAGDLASLQADLVELGKELGILAQPEHVEASAHEVLEWLSNHTRWLVVYDDADGYTMLRPFLPSPCRGHVLVTSRACAWRGIAQVVELPRLSPAAARNVLVQRGGQPDDGHANAVAEALGHLPLALVQAGAYVEATACSFRDYLELFEQHGLSLLDDPKAVPDGDSQTVARTWEVSLAEIRARSLAAADLLDWLAFLDSGGVPLELLRTQAASMPKRQRACMGSPRALDDAIAVLREFGMIERDEGVLRVHRLIQAVTREKLKAAERRRLAAAVVRWVCALFAFSPGETLVRNVPDGIAEQILAVSTIDACTKVEEERLARVLFDVGDFHLMCGASHPAHTAYSRAVALCEARVKAEACTQTRRDLSSALNRLGAVEARAGQVAAARWCFSRAFELRKALVLENPFCPRSQDDLASSLSRLGEVELPVDEVAAADLFAQAVDLREALVGITPEDTLAWRALALSSRKLGKTQARLGSLDAAKHTLQCALDIVETLAGADPHNRMARRDLSLVLTDLGDVLAHGAEHEAACELLERALAIAEASAMEDPESAQAQRDLSICLNRCGLAAQRDGRLADARHAMERSLTLRQALVRADPQDAGAQRDLVLSLDKLGELEELAGNVEAAHEHRRRATDIRETLGAKPSTEARALASVEHGTNGSLSFDSTDSLELSLHGWRRPSPGGDLTHVGRLEQAEQRASARGKYRQAVRHAVELDRFGKSALRAGNLEMARQSFRRQVSLFNVLAKVTPSSRSAKIRTAKALYSLAKVEQKLGELEHARDHFHRASEIFGSLLATTPTDAKLQRNLAVCLSKLGVVEMERGNLPRAREALTRGSASFEVLRADAPGSVEALRDLGISLAELGTLEERSGAPELARGLFRRHLDIEYELAELEPSGRAGRRSLLRALRRLTNVEVRLGNRPEALDLFQKLLAEQDALAHADPEEAWAALDLVLLHAEPLTLA